MFTRSNKTVPDFLKGEEFIGNQAVLDQDPPLYARMLVRVLASKLTIDPSIADRLRKLGKQGPVVYAMKHPSSFDLNILRMRFAQMGLPIPAYSFGTSASSTGTLRKVLKVTAERVSEMYKPRTDAQVSDTETLRDILLNGGAAVFVLADDDTFRQRYVDPDKDPVQVLLDTQGKIPASISVVPMMILYDRTPRSGTPSWRNVILGDPDRIGPLRRIQMAVRTWIVPELLVGDPIHLIGEFEEFGAETDWDDLPFELRRRLLESINTRIRVNRGPVKRSRTEVKELVLQEERVQQAVTDMAVKESSSSAKARKKAEAYVDEIAADQRISGIHFFYYVLKWVMFNIFQGVDYRPEEFSELREWSAKRSLIFVPCHKSHFDYFLVLWLAFVNRMAVPHTAAGKNLSFWPAGPMLRTGGAFFLRRSLKGMQLYKEVFAAYVRNLLREKVNIVFYPEGGRSRTGKLLQPRLGMLTFLIEAIEAGDVEDLLFVPTFQGYDQIPEESAYLRELSGYEKKAESVRQVLQARKILSKKFGKAYVRFHRPLSYTEFREQWKTRQNNPDLSPLENRRFLQDFANYLMFGIVEVSVVSPIELTAAAALSCSKSRLTFDEIREASAIMTSALAGRGTEIAGSAGGVEDSVRAALRVFLSRGFVKKETNGETEGRETYIIEESNRPNLEFYRNPLINHLWPCSLTAMLLLKEDTPPSRPTPEMHRRFSDLCSLLLKELTVDPLQLQEEILDETWKMFRQMGWIQVEEGSGKVELNREVLSRLTGIMSDLVSVYYLILAVSEETDTALGNKELLKRMTERAKELRNGSVPSFSSVIVRNATVRFNELGVSTARRVQESVSEEADGIQELKKTLKRVIEP
jgi:glycerol-3-phosphate O-acyltransferase